MFGKSKGQKQRKRNTEGDGTRPKQSLAQFGLLDIPNVSDLALGGGIEDDGDDSDLEAELLALTGGGSSREPKRVKKVVNPENLDKMVAECMNDNYDDDALDEDDPDLLAELSALGPPEDDEELDNSHTATPFTPDKISSPAKPAPVATPFTPDKISSPAKPAPVIIRPSPMIAGVSVVHLLKERIEMYKQAEENALSAGETARAKRFTRGLKTMNQMLKSVNAGGNINEEDIPPSVLLQSSRNNSTSDLAEPKESPKPVPPSRVSSSTLAQGVIFNENKPSTDETPSVLSVILDRQREYKMAALSAKKKGSKDDAVQLMRTAKQFDPLIQAVKDGQNVDLESLPPPPNSPSKISTEVKSNPQTNPNPRTSLPSAEVNNPPEQDSAAQPLPQPAPAPSNPTSILEALEQRLGKYTEQRDKAKAGGDARKQRMNERIMKQYQEAIKTHKMGQMVDFSELPTPPGFPPIPAGGFSSPSDTPKPQPSQSSAVAQPMQPSSNTQVKPQVPQRQPNTQPQPPKLQPKINVRKNPQSMVERQLSVLKRRHEQFKSAALEAKKRGEIEQAKEYVRNYKGIEQLIGATEGGLPVEMNTVPIPPQEQLGCENTSVDFEMIDKEDCLVAPPTTDADMAITYTKLEEDLIAQIKMCAHTREHFKALGDVASANRFEQLILHTKKDLDAIRAGFKRGDTPPRFHYENRTFTLIQCNTDLNDSDCEVCIVRGINFNVPNPADVDTYVKIEFPYPTDAPPQERTIVVKDTNNPEFNHKVVFSIDRKARALSRVFKRHSVKCQVIAKGGWFHKDSVLGSIKIPLVDLETKCTVHDSYDLIDEKKKMIGGKLEVKVRVRNPILSKQLEKVTEKWIIIDGF